MGGLFGSLSPEGGGLFGLAQIRRKVFISFHHGNDRIYYEQFSHTFCDQYDVFYDNSPERAINSDDVDYIRWRLWDEHITNTSCTIVLIGRDTWGRKFVDWEICGTLEKEHGLIGVMLPSASLGLLSAALDSNSLPLRLQDNVHTRYASVYSWNGITANTAALKNAIEFAVSSPGILIDNSRPRRERNASLWW
jgi:hypothetical protein